MLAAQTKMVTDAVEKACVPFKILSNRLIQVQVAIHRIGVDALIDTGASMSFIHVNLWRHIDELNGGRIQLQPSIRGYQPVIYWRSSADIGVV